MLPQPMMPMSMDAIVLLDIHSADVGIADAHGPSGISRLVMLHDHPPGTGRAGSLPEIGPI